MKVTRGDVVLTRFLRAGLACVAEWRHRLAHRGTLWRLAEGPRGGVAAWSSTKWHTLARRDQWHRGGVAEWRSGGVAEWRSDKMAG
jgi:hypothetical protein